MINAFATQRVAFKLHTLIVLSNYAFLKFKVAAKPGDVALRRGAE